VRQFVAMPLHSGYTVEEQIEPGAARLVVPHTVHLGRSSGAGLLTVCQMP